MSSELNEIVAEPKAEEVTEKASEAAVAEEVKAEEPATEQTKTESAPAPQDNRDYELRVSDEELAKKKKMKEIWDKFTTGLLIFLMASPILILAYIFIWFLTK